MAQQLVAPLAAPCRGAPASRRRPVVARVAAAPAGQNGGGKADGVEVHREMMSWLARQGLPEQGVELCDQTGFQMKGYPMGVTVASRDLAAGETALSVPVDLCVTLDRVFEDSTMAELLTTEKVSELASLTLYLCYEKRLGAESEIAPFIRELDRQRARGQQAVPSPLLWSADEVDTLLQGSPVVGQIRERLEMMRKEYDELDTVWYMASALFNKYPFDPPTEAFSFDVFKQAFCAVQASVVHLRGADVPMSQRFAIVPMGPPMCQYKSNSRAAFAYNPASKSVDLTVDVPYARGEAVAAWCGPQPNSKLLINYGICNDDNPFDTLPLTAQISQNDPLLNVKRAALKAGGMSTRQDFKLSRQSPVPEQLLPFLRLAHAETPEEVAAVSLEGAGAPANPHNESLAVSHLVGHLRARLSAYPTTVEMDRIMEQDPRASAKQRVAARLVRIEKEILQAGLDQALGLGAAPHEGTYLFVTLSVPGGDAALCG